SVTGLVEDCGQVVEARLEPGRIPGLVGAGQPLHEPLAAVRFLPPLDREVWAAVTVLVGPGRDLHAALVRDRLIEQVRELQPEREQDVADVAGRLTVEQRLGVMVRDGERWIPVSPTLTVTRHRA